MNKCKIKVTSFISFSHETKTSLTIASKLFIFIRNFFFTNYKKFQSIFLSFPYLNMLQKQKNFLNKNRSFYFQLGFWFFRLQTIQGYQFTTAQSSSSLGTSLFLFIRGKNSGKTLVDKRASLMSPTRQLTSSQLPQMYTLII